MRLQTNSTMSEISAADRMDDDSTLDVAKSDDEGLLTNPSTDAADGNACFRKDLFPFSRPTQWYEGVVVFVVVLLVTDDFVVCCLFCSVSVFLLLFLERICLLFVLVSIVKSKWSGPGRILQTFTAGTGHRHSFCHWPSVSFAGSSSVKHPLHSQLF